MTGPALRCTPSAAVVAAAVGVFYSPAAFGAGDLVDHASHADLIYDSSNGNVRLDATEAAGAIITNFVLLNFVGGPDFNAPNVVVFPRRRSSSRTL